MRHTISYKLTRRLASGSPVRAAFTLVELLVVVTLITLLIGLLVPTMGKSIRQARSTICKSNLKDIFRTLDMYQTENNGWIPTVDAATAFRSTDSWAIKLFQRNPAGAGVLVCPDDPWAAVMRNSMVVGGLEHTPTVSYGMNDFIVSSPDSFLAHLGRYRPKRPGETLLIADLGPDPLGGSAAGDGSATVPPVRNFGRLAIDDGYRPGDLPDVRTSPWVTDRHMGRINALTMLGNVIEINIAPVMHRPIASYYAECAAQYCTMCVDLDIAHYSFAESRAFWWTGPVPRQ